MNTTNTKEQGKHTPEWNLSNHGRGNFTKHLSNSKTGQNLGIIDLGYCPDLKTAEDIFTIIASAPELLKENEQLKRLLHDLTPGGSEFYNDPEYCAKWIRESRQENHYQLGGIIKETKKENEQLKKQIKSVEKVSYETSKANADYIVKNEQLKEQVKLLREALVMLYGVCKYQYTNINANDVCKIESALNQTK